MRGFGGFVIPGLVMACIMTLARSFEINKGQLWPKECAGKNYCFTKPADYPSTEKIEELLKASNIDFAKIQEQKDKMKNRAFVNECRVYLMKDVIYRIIDTNGHARYVLQDPSIFEFTPEIEECYEHQDLQEHEGKLECVQQYAQLRFVVMTLDRTSVELADIKQGLPFGCGLTAITEY